MRLLNLPPNLSRLLASHLNRGNLTRLMAVSRNNPFQNVLNRPGRQVELQDLAFVGTRMLRLTSPRSFIPMARKVMPDLRKKYDLSVGEEFVMRGKYFTLVVGQKGYGPGGKIKVELHTANRRRWLLDMTLAGSTVQVKSEAWFPRPWQNAFEDGMKAAARSVRKRFSVVNWEQTNSLGTYRRHTRRSL